MADYVNYERRRTDRLGISAGNERRNVDGLLSANGTRRTGYTKLNVACFHPVRLRAVLYVNNVPFTRHTDDRFSCVPFRRHVRFRRFRNMFCFSFGRYIYIGTRLKRFSNLRARPCIFIIRKRRCLQTVVEIARGFYRLYTAYYCTGQRLVVSYRVCIIVALRNITRNCRCFVRENLGDVIARRKIPSGRPRTIDDCRIT